MALSSVGVYVRGDVDVDFAVVGAGTIVAASESDVGDVRRRELRFDCGAVLWIESAPTRGGRVVTVSSENRRVSVDLDNLIIRLSLAVSN